MAQTKKQQEEVKRAMGQSPPSNERDYFFNIEGCPGYEGYFPKRLNHEVCKYCGNHHYYH